MNQTMISPELVAPIFNPATFSNRRHVENLVATLKQLLREMTPEEVTSLWKPSLNAWCRTLATGHVTGYV